MHTCLKKQFKIALLFLTTVFFLAPSLLTLPIFAHNSDEEMLVATLWAQVFKEQLEQVQRDLDDIRKRQESLKNNISQQNQIANMYSGKVGELRGQVEELQLGIAENEAEISEIELSSQLLEEEIATLEASITELETAVDTTETESSKILVNSYIDHRLYNSLSTSIFDITDVNTYFKDSQYRELIQEDNRILLEKLHNDRISLERSRNELEEKRVTIKRNRSILSEQKSQLERAKADLESQMQSYTGAILSAQYIANQGQNQLNVAEDDEAKLQARMELLKQQLFNSIIQINSGKYEEAGTIIGFEGNTGISTGPHLHFMFKPSGNSGDYANPCNYLPGRQLANAYCGVGSPSLPVWPINGNVWLTSGFRTASRPTHSAIDFSTGGGAPIYAAHSGWIQYGNDGACSYYSGPYPCNGAGANYAIICENKNCSNGKMSGYWHLQ
jgi:predicted nuclease with TOPRIM domain